MKCYGKAWAGQERKSGLTSESSAYKRAPDIGKLGTTRGLKKYILFFFLFWIPSLS